MEISFSNPVSFDSNDIQALMEPNVFYVGAMFSGSEDQLPDFINRGIWIGLGLNSPQVERVRQIRKGDILSVKRLAGKGATTMRILALGVVVGLTPQQTSDSAHVLVAWVMPSMNLGLDVRAPDQDAELRVPLKEVGTISAPQKLTELDTALAAQVAKCRVRFLRMNLDIRPRHYF
jgi:hypothetical protein